MTVSANPNTPWLLLVFSLPARQASARVEVWRKLQRYGAVALRGSGYLLPHTPASLERFQWLSALIRGHNGEAAVVHVQSLDGVRVEAVRKLFVDARSKDYEALARELQRARRPAAGAAGKLGRLRRRFQEIAAIDFFNNPLRGRVEAMLASLDAGPPGAGSALSGGRMKEKFRNRTWVTRPRPGIDRAASAWLIHTFIDPKARFAFAGDPAERPAAVPFDMFGGAGFGHQGDRCTFETLRKQFAVRDPKVRILAEMVHDADLGDEKYGRPEALGIDRVLIGWAKEGLPDAELLRRGMGLIAGLYSSL